MQKATIDKQIRKLATTAKSISLFAAPDLDAAKKKAEDARKIFKRRKMETMNPAEQGHVKNMDELTDRCGEGNADAFFREFVEKVHDHHERAKQYRPRG